MPDQIETPIPALLGLRLSQASEICKQRGIHVRVASLNGKTFDMARLVMQNRVNFHVEDGFVTEYAFY